MFRDAGIDLLAGPGEIVVMADETTDPELVAADLLTQAEHDANARPLLVTTDERTGQQVIDRIGPYRAIGYGMVVLGVTQIGRSTAVGFASMLAFAILLGVGGSGISFGLPNVVLCGIACTVGIAALLAQSVPLLVPVIGVVIAGIGVEGTLTGPYVPGFGVLCVACLAAVVAPWRLPV